MASIAFSIGVFVLVVVVFVGGYLTWQNIGLTNENSNLRETLNQTQTQNNQLRSQMGDLQQQVIALQAEVNQLSIFSAFERLTLSSAVASGPSSGLWSISLTGQNDGANDSTIIEVQVNGGAGAANWMGCAGTSCNPTNTTYLVVPAGNPFFLRFALNASAYPSGHTVDVRLITSSNSYLEQIELPGTSSLSESILLVMANASVTSSPAPGWNLTLSGRNTAATSILFRQIQLNGAPIPSTMAVSVNGGSSAAFSNASISPGAAFTFVICLPASGLGNQTFKGGQEVNVTLMTTQGSFVERILLPSSSQYENLEIVTNYAVASGSGSWALVIGGFNEGTVAAAVQQIQINGVIAGTSGAALVMSSLVNGDMVSYPGTVIPAGSSFNFIFSVFGVSTGQAIQVKITTAQGTYTVQVPTT